MTSAWQPRARSGSAECGLGDRGARPGRAVGAGRCTAPTAQAAPLPLSGPSPARCPGRRPPDARAALAGIVFVLKTGMSWNQLPTALVGCSGVTCWRRLRDWTEAGVWPALHEQLLDQLRALGELDLDVAAVDGSHIRALKGGTTSARRRSTAGGPAPSTT